MSEKFFDVHTHLNLKFDDDWQTAGRRALATGARFVNVGADQASSALALEQAEWFGDGVWATAGLHPHEAGPTAVDDLAAIRALALHERTVAIGECGLDYFKLTDGSLKAEQKKLFSAQVELALALGKPLMIHCREAETDLWSILNEYKRQAGSRLKFDLHFFTGDWATAKKFLNLDGYFSFPGVITFAASADETIRNAPLERVMTETDAPFAAPVPHRGQRNEPSYVWLVAERLAVLRPESRAAVLVALVANAERFFNLADFSSQG